MQLREIESNTGGSFHAYVATPAAGSGPGLVVIQEIFGINSVMRNIADAYAGAGYVAVVPDLFWRQQPGIELSSEVAADWPQALALYQNFDEDKGVEDLRDTLNYLRNLPECTGKVGTVGFCLGGKLAYLMATRSDADCNVSYYGVGIENNLHESGNIQTPLILHLAEQDQFVPPEVQEQIKAGVKDHPLVTVYSYAEVDHAFGRVGGKAYVAEAAELAESRTLALFRESLG